LIVADAGAEAENWRAAGRAAGRRAGSMTRDEDAIGAAAARRESWPNEAERAERAPRANIVVVRCNLVMLSTFS